MLGILPSNKVGREKGAILQVCDSCNCQEAVRDSYNHWEAVCDSYNHREAVCDSYNHREAVCDSYNHREAVCDSALSKKNPFFFKKKVRIDTYMLPLGQCNIMR